MAMLDERNYAIEATVWSLLVRIVIAGCCWLYPHYHPHTSYGIAMFLHVLVSP